MLQLLAETETCPRALRRARDGLTSAGEWLRLRALGGAQLLDVSTAVPAVLYALALPVRMYLTGEGLALHAAAREFSHALALVLASSVLIKAVPASAKALSYGMSGAQQAAKAAAVATLRDRLSGTNGAEEEKRGHIKSNQEGPRSPRLLAQPSQTLTPPPPSRPAHPCS